MLEFWVLKRGLFINYIFCDNSFVKLLVNNIFMDRFKVWENSEKVCVEYRIFLDFL